MLSLFAVLLPGLAMGVLLALAPSHWGFPSLLSPSGWPLEFWCMVAGGLPATLAGLLDWRFHHAGRRAVGRREHRVECVAMSCGAPLFVLLVLASVSDEPQHWVAPITAIALTMAVLVAYDEVHFHRACGRYETALHRLLVGGNTVAFLAWLHWAMG